MKHTLQITNPRKSRRELAAQWSEYRAAIKRLHVEGLYGAAAVLRGQLNLTAKVWNHYRTGALRGTETTQRQTIQFPETNVPGKINTIESNARNDMSTYDPLGHSEWRAMESARNFQIAAHHMAEETGRIHPLADTQCQGCDTTAAPASDPCTECRQAKEREGTA